MRGPLQLFVIKQTSTADMGLFSGAETSFGPILSVPGSLVTILPLTAYIIESCLLQGPGYSEGAQLHAVRLIRFPVSSCPFRPPLCHRAAERAPNWCSVHQERC